MFKRVLSITIAVIMVMSTSSFATEIGETAIGKHTIDYNKLTDNEKLVYDFFNIINTGDWNKWACKYTPTVRNNYFKLVKNYNNRKNNIGILTVKTAKVLQIQKISNNFAPYYKELEKFYTSGHNYECYRVNIDTTVKEENGYFSNGVSSHLVVLVRERNKWGVGAICGNNISQPSKINVIDQNGKLHKNVKFKNYVFNATCNELGNNIPDIQAIKANAMAIKMCGWWSISKKYRESEGCDIKYGDVAFKDVNDVSLPNQKVIKKAIDEIWNYSMKASNDKVFYSAYYTGKYNSDIGGNGCLSQNGSKYWANKNKDWKWILHHYYDNSTYNNTNTGLVKIENEIISGNIKESVLTFPISDAGKTEYNKEIYSIEPFNIKLNLPIGWTCKEAKIKESGKSTPLIGLFAIIDIYNDDNIRVGSIGYNTYNTEKGYENDPRAIFSMIAIGNDYQFNVREHYHTILDEGTVSVATVGVYHSAAFDNTENEKINPGILAYDRNKKVYIGAEFDSSEVSEEIVEKIAGSIKIYLSK